MSKYLNVEFGTGKVYEKSNDPREGYEEFVSSKGNKTFRKYYTKGVYGTLTAVEKRDSPIGEQIQLVLKDKSGEFQNLQFSLYDTNGNIDNRFAENLIRTLPNVKIGENYRIFPYVIEADEKNKYGSSGVSIVKANIEAETVNKEDKVELAYRYLKKDEEAKDTDVPKLIFKEQRGKNRPTAASLEEKTNFLYDVLMANSTKGESQSQTSNTPPSPKVDDTKGVAAQYENDSLPF